MLVDEHGRPIGNLHARPNVPSSFDTQGKLLYHDPKIGLTIYAGNVFEARTVKNVKTYLIAMRVMGGYMFYGQGDNVRKAPLTEFIRAIESGLFEPKSIREIDPEKIDQTMIGLDAIANRRTAEESIMYMGEEAEARFHEGN